MKLYDILDLLGFLDTRASLLMDLVIVFLATLPLLSGISILFAIKKIIKVHQFSQFLLFFLTVTALVLFAYIVHFNKGFEVLLEKSSINHTLSLVILSSHIIVTLTTLTLWMFALIYALSDRKRKGLPGVYSRSHAKAGKRVFKGIVLTSFTSVGIYLMLYTV